MRNINSINLCRYKYLQLVCNLMPHIHLIIGLIIANILHINFSLNLLLILGCVLPDTDIILGFLQKKNHRTYFSHYPITWLFFAIIALIFRSDIYWFFLGGFIHVISDIFDWNVLIFAPFSAYRFSLLNFDPEEILSESSPKTSIRNYYQKPQVQIFELLILLLGAISIFWS
jgi:hypothetical protein